MGELCQSTLTGRLQVPDPGAYQERGFCGRLGWPFGKMQQSWSGGRALGKKLLMVRCVVMRRRGFCLRGVGFGVGGGGSLEWSRV
jgi:hypothetical protein